MVNVFDDSVTSGSVGNLQVMKKIGQQWAGLETEMQQSDELGFTPYRLHTRPDGTFVYVLDDVTTMVVTARQIAKDGSKLIYFVKGDDGDGVGFALHGDRGLSGARGLKGDSGDCGVAGSRGPTGKRGKRLVKLDRQGLLEVKAVLEAKAILELMVKKVKREMLVVVVL